ncbi:hypothetical protein GCM10009582_13300 [Arthrobacter flavus]|uniref:DUF222 domain-containing protein n=1 Tax=Arthrobacter flavus TaxID=95172 RepID=UPI0031D958F8
MKQQEEAGVNRSIAAAATEVELAGPESLVAMLLPWEANRVPAKEPAGQDADGPADKASEAASDPVATISDLLLAADRLLSWVTARQAELVVDLHREVQSLAASRPASRQGVGTGLGFTLTAEELAPLLNLSGRAAHRLLGHSLTLALDLPETLQCLGMGVISVRQAQIIAEEALFLPAEVLSGFEDQVLQRGAHLTPPRLTSLCHRIREKLHPDSITTRKAAAVEDRHVELTPAHDGMAWFSAYLPAEQACGIEHRLTFMARALQHPHEDRTLTQLKTDVLTDLLTHHCEPGTTGNPGATSTHTTGTPGTGELLW